MNPDAILRASVHRPWPLPDKPWIMVQTWHDLLFAHWPIPPEIMRQSVPPELPLDLYEGQAWVGVIPFHMSNVRPRWIPPLPGFSRFPEMNVRTYVTLDNKPGVFFFSLDAGNLPAVWAAARFTTCHIFTRQCRFKSKDITLRTVPGGIRAKPHSWLDTVPPARHNCGSAIRWITG